MGCGCGGGRRNASRSGSAAPRPAAAPSARMVQNQSVQRRAMVEQARERIQQNSGGKAPNAVGGRTDMERRRRIQVSLRNRNSKG